MKLYRLKGRWVNEEEAESVLKSWVEKHGHYCNQIADPGVCCPVAHEEENGKCTCAVLEILKYVEVPNSSYVIVSIGQVINNGQYAEIQNGQ